MASSKILSLVVILLFLVSFLRSHRAEAEILTLNSYLKQVDSLNAMVRSNLLTMKANQNKAAEGSLDFSTQLYGGGTYSDDKKPQPGQAAQFYGTETIAESANLGVQTKFRTGTQVNFAYNMTYANVYNSGFAPPFGLYTGSPSLTITQPLWQDFNAALSKANETAMQASYLVQGLQNLYSAQNINFQAETTFWRLALFRQIVALDKDSIARTEKILEHNKRRASMNVADRSDVLQSEAALKAKELQYQSDLETLRETSAQFNSLRNLHGDTVGEELPALDSSIEKEVSGELKRVSDRVDVLMAHATAQNQRALAKAASQRMAPTLNLFGTAQFNALSQNWNYATGESFNADNPTYSAGLKFSLNIDGGTVHRITEGYEAAAQAAELLAERAKFDLDQDWFELLKKFKDGLARFQMAKDLVELQAAKVKNERSRFSAGRTTAFQVLTFEDDYFAAQLSRLRIASDLITFRAQARLYNGESL